MYNPTMPQMMPNMAGYAPSGLMPGVGSPQIGAHQGSFVGAPMGPGVNNADPQYRQMLIQALMQRQGAMQGTMPVNPGMSPMRRIMPAPYNPGGG